MIRQKITQQELLDAVKEYEKEERGSNFVIALDTMQQVCRFKAARREKMVIIVLGGGFSSQQEQLLKTAQEQILADVSLSDNVDFYTTGVITDKRATELETPLRQAGLSVSFFDASKMEDTVQFQSLMEHEEERKKDTEIDPAYFDYLAMSNDSSDIKNGFFYSLMLMEVYRNQPITEADFIEICQAKYGRNETDVKIALRNLRKNGKIGRPQKGGVFKLTDGEQKVLEQAVKESKSQEMAFMESLEAIAVKYDFKDRRLLLEKLKEEYLAKYTIFSKMDEDFDNGVSTLCELLSGLGEEKEQAMLEELRKLCEHNDYLDQYGLINSFLGLFRSDRYEEYISKKESNIYLDTPFIVNYLCYKSMFQEEYDIEWDNTEFISARDLIGYKDSVGNSVRFIVPYDYMQEVLGELKKALQFTWFEQFDDLPIPMETANVFYNYYKQVKEYKKDFDGGTCDFSFEDFANLLGFDELNVSNAYFFKTNMGNLRYFLTQLGCETLGKVEVSYPLFDTVKTDYSWYLRDKNKEKTDHAINADVRQSLYITEQAKANRGAGQEYYVTSWDNTLYHLRDKVKTEMEIAGRSYNVFKPGELAEKLAFRSFHISKESVSNELFTYANSSFNVNDKIKSLYDNVLNPFFASFGKPNMVLFREILKMEKASMEGETEASSRGDKTALENIFLSIIHELPKHNCSPQNLKDYLNDDDNNAVIIPIFNQAFADYKKKKKVAVAEQVCEKIKAYVSKEDKEIKL